MYYSLVGMLAALILLIENRDIIIDRNGAFKKSAWLIYRRFLIAVLIYYVTDILWGFLEAKKLAFLLFADTTVYYAAMAAGVFFWAQYTVVYLMEGNNCGRFLIYAGHAIAATIIGLAAINVYLPVLFTVDAAAVYEPLPLRHVMLAVQIIFLFLISCYAVYQAITKNHTARRRRGRTLAFFGMIMSVFLFLQMWFPYLPLYSIAYMLGICVIHTFVITDEKEEYRLELLEAEKSRRMNQAISSLMDNFPGRAFTKDAATGKYIACNREFAEFAGLKSPEEVIGHTAAQLFEQETADQFAEDDRIAFSMDGPYIFYEHLPDAQGNIRQYQTTKKKYLDFSGRFCIVGTCQDVSDMVRIQRENIETRKAYEKARVISLIYNHIAQALSRGYTDLFYVNVETGSFTEYRADPESGMLEEVRTDTDFFTRCRPEAVTNVYPDDMETFSEAMERDTLMDALNKNGLFVMTYRRLVDGKPVYVTMRVSRIKDDNRYIVIGVSDIDDQMKQRLAAEKMREEHVAYARLNALTGEYLCVYIVDPVSGSYRLLSITSGYEELSLPANGSNFFETAREITKHNVYPDDVNRFISLFTRENVMAELESGGIYALSFRMSMAGRPTYVQLRAAAITENNTRSLIVGISDVDFQVRQEEDYARRLTQALSQANVDALTGVKSKHAYMEEERTLNLQIRVRHAPPFALALLDLNDLKAINDNQGHQAGDQYLRDACRIICEIFKRCPVYRIGGDEFTVLIRGSEYERVDELAKMVSDHNEEALKSGGIVIACGIARFNPETDDCVTAVFSRADRTMYENKHLLKSRSSAEEASLRS